MNASKRLSEAHSQVNEALDIERQHYKSIYDKKAVDITFEESDRVWLAAKLRKSGLSSKLQPKWLGPFKIIVKQGLDDYFIQADDNKKPLTVHQSIQGRINGFLSHRRFSNSGQLFLKTLSTEKKVLTYFLRPHLWIRRLLFFVGHRHSAYSA